MHPQIAARTDVRQGVMHLSRQRDAEELQQSRQPEVRRLLAAQVAPPHGERQRVPHHHVRRQERLDAIEGLLDPREVEGSHVVATELCDLVREVLGRPPYFADRLVPAQKAVEPQHRFVVQTSSQVFYTSCR